VDPEIRKVLLVLEPHLVLDRQETLVFQMVRVVLWDRLVRGLLQTLKTQFRPVVHLVLTGLESPSLRFRRQLQSVQEFPVRRDFQTIQFRPRVL